MDVNNPQNQSYWFVVREDQSNVIISSNNFTIQNPQNTASQETRYIVDASDNRQYIQINEAPVAHTEDTSETCEKEIIEPPKQEDNFWDRNKIKMLLKWCLDNKFRINNRDKALWEEAAEVLGTTPDEFDRKYRNLRRTYIRLLKQKRLGKEIKWVHYNLCEEVYMDCKSHSYSMMEPWEDDEIRSLLNLYIENINKFRSDCLKKEVWKDIARQLGTTEYNCYHKFKNLKRTYFTWLVRSRENSKLIMWPYQHYFDRIFYEYNPNLGPWDQSKIKLLIGAYAQMAHKFRNPKFQKKELWKEISATVGESPDNCDKKFRNLKQTYQRLKMRAVMGRPITKWRYYKDFEHVYENQNYSRMEEGLKHCIYKSEDQDYVKQLLTFYLENKDKFRDPLVKKKTMWRIIGPKIGLSPGECDKKFRNIKQTYLRLAEKKRQTGKGSTWPYYSYFEQIYSEPKGGRERSHTYNVDNATLSEIKKAVKSVCHTKEKDKFEMLVQAIEESNNIQRERNRILQALLDRR